uniref:Uncharacterized protein n=1 Tax=Setaria viridis TaxID=4556 RepID=A0A4U6TY12_SETVI|nr:hypothetical protein SEVIR_8G257300v2 [Setaria viridis]
MPHQHERHLMLLPIYFQECPQNEGELAKREIILNMGYTESKIWFYSRQNANMLSNIWSCISTLVLNLHFRIALMLFAIQFMTSNSSGFQSYDVCGFIIL